MLNTTRCEDPADLEDGVLPKFCRARNVQYYAVKLYFEKELERLQEEGIISPIEWYLLLNVTLRRCVSMVIIR